MGIVRVVLMLIPDNTRAFLQERQRARAAPVVGRLAWAAFARWAVLGSSPFLFLSELVRCFSILVLSHICINNIKSHKCPKFMKLILLGF
jgi:hypothetical protein